ncbi:MAG: serine/threonine protein kinase [Hormoscilla sp.]
MNRDRQINTSDRMSIVDGIGQTFRYTTYGLTLQASRHLPGLIPASINAPVDVRVDLMRESESQLPSPEVEAVSSGLNLLSKADGTYFHLWFRGDGQLDFDVNSEGTHIRASWDRSVIEEVTALLLGQVLGLALRLRGILCLHACVVRIGQQAIAIVGETGAGKSTTAVALARRGHSILSDDIAVLDDRRDRFLVQPGYPRVRLWPKSIKALYGSEVDLARVFSFSEKRFVNLTDNINKTAGETGWQFHHEPLPLAAIYILGKRQPFLAETAIEPIPPAMAVMMLMAQRSAIHLKLDMEKQGREFAGISRMVRTVPVRKVTPRDSLDALPQLCDAILADFANITTPEKCTQLSKTLDG